MADTLHFPEQYVASGRQAEAKTGRFWILPIGSVWRCQASAAGEGWTAKLLCPRPTAADIQLANCRELPLRIRNADFGTVQ